MGWIVTGLNRQVDGKGCATTLLAVNSNSAIQGQDKLVDEREVNAHLGAVVIINERLRQRFKDVFLFFGRDTIAGIAHTELDSAVLGECQCHLDTAVAGRKFEGVGNQPMDDFTYVFGCKSHRHRVYRR